MKVLMIAPQPFLEPRGTPISVYQRLYALSKLGYDVDLLTYHLGDDVNLPGVKIHRIPYIPLIKRLKVGPSWAKIPLDLLLFIKSIVMLIKNRYEIIHTHEEAGIFSVILATIFRVPHLYDMHSSLPKQLMNFNFCNYRPVIKLFEVLEKWVLKTCNVVITIGKDLEEHVLTVYPEANLFRIENTAIFEDSTFEGGDESVIKDQLGLNGKLPIVYTGTFESYQGLDILIESARIVRRAHQEVAFIMVGGNSTQINYWKSRVNELNLEDIVIFVGTVPMEESVKYLDIAEILVSPRTEGLSVPLKLYSYLRSGKPTVATDIFAHTQILNNEVAVIVDKNPIAFAEGLLKLVRNPDLRAQIGDRARSHAEAEFSMHSYLGKLEKAYLSVKSSKSPKKVAQGESGSKDILHAK